MRIQLFRPALAAAFAVGLLGPVTFAAAEDPELEMEPTRVDLMLGSDQDNMHRYHPDHLTFESGELYTLVLSNPSNNVHEIDSPGFVGAVKSVEVITFDDIGSDAQPISNVVGTPIEIEVFPGGKTEWTFFAVIPGEYPVICATLDKDGKTHEEHGMKGTLTVE